MIKRTLSRHQGMRQVRQRRDYRAPRILQVECPICGGRLRGMRATGFQCTKCNAHHSTQYVRYLQTHHLRSIIHTHFSEKRPTINTAADVQTTAQQSTPAELSQPTQDAMPSAALHEETQHIIMPDDDGRLSAAIEEVKHAVRNTTQNLEGLLVAQEEAKHDIVQEAIQAIRPPAKASTKRVVSASKITTKTRTQSVVKSLPKASNTGRTSKRRNKTATRKKRIATKRRH